MAFPERDRDGAVAVASEHENSLLEPLHFPNLPDCAFEIRLCLSLSFRRYLVHAESREHLVLPGERRHAAYALRVELAGRDACSAGPSPRAGERSADEVAKERRRSRGPRLELGVELAGHEPRVIAELDDLDEASFLVRP